MKPIRVKRLQRGLSLLLCLGLLIGLCACGNVADGDSEASSTASRAEASSQTVQSSEVGTEEPSYSWQTEELYSFTRESFPVMDGSTSLVPLGEAIASAVLKSDQATVSDLISFNRTTQSLRNLANGDCELVIAAEPESTAFDEMAAAGFQCESQTIAREGLVFLVNEDNPVDSLTTEQLVGIFSGEITNWSQVGGNDQPIEAFRRNAGAGSQVMMEKLVMQGTPMAESQESYVVDSMGMLISAVRSYDNSANAIGYTVYYYANDMNMADGLKLLKVDGVKPCADTIRSGDYPFINGYYSFISADTAPDSPARVLYDWLMTTDGQQLLALEGYVTVADLPEAYDASACVGGVDVDFSGLEVSETTVYTPYPGEAPKDLTAADTYGTIYPYAGVPLYENYEDENGEEMSYLSGYLYGFMDESGNQLTAPAYAKIELCRSTDTYYNEYTESYPVWVFCTVDNVQEQQEEDYMYLDGDTRYGMATLSGDKVLDCCYQSVYGTGGYIVAVRDNETGAFTVFDKELNVVLDSDDLECRDGLASWNYPRFSEGLFSITTLKGTCFVDVSGNTVLGPYSYATDFYNGYAQITDEEMLDYYINSGGERLELPAMEYGGGFIGGCATVRLASGEEALINTDGEVLVTTAGMISSWSGGWIVSDEADSKRDYYDWQGVLCYSAEADSKDEPLSRQVLAVYSDDGVTLRRQDTGEELLLEGAKTCFAMNGYNPEEEHVFFRVVRHSDEGDDWHCWLVDENLQVIAQSDKGVDLLVDGVTGEYMAISLVNDNQRYEVYDTNGSLYLTVAGSPELYGGRVMAVNEECCTLYNSDGTVIYRYFFY